jgi:hypothetical protein
MRSKMLHIGTKGRRVTQIATGRRTSGPIAAIVVPHPQSDLHHAADSLGSAHQDKRTRR